MAPTSVALGLVIAIAIAVFVPAYRHALRHWVGVPGAALPTAAAAPLERARRVAAWRSFHAAAIALAFVSIALMGAMFLAIVAIVAIA